MTFRKVFFSVIAFLIVISVGFIWWASSTAPVTPEALSALTSDGQVVVTEGKYLVFTPGDRQVETGYIFYPGGRVDFRAYAPYAHLLAESGYLVVIVKMPLNLAVFNVNLAEEVIENYPLIKSWVIGGHSLGGAMAANFVVNHQEMIDGLVLLASYPADSDDLSDYAGLVTSISGTLGGLATPEKILASFSRLPGKTVWVPIEGGNHANFGWYGEQKGDNPAEISREDQQAIVFLETISLLAQID